MKDSDLFLFTIMVVLAFAYFIFVTVKEFRHMSNKKYTEGETPDKFGKQ